MTGEHDRTALVSTAVSTEASIDDAVDAARRGDEQAFGVVLQRYRWATRFATTTD